MSEATGLRRLSVHADSARIDAALSAAMPVESLIPALVEALSAGSDFTAGPAAVRYHLTTHGGAKLDPSKTLSELGIRDGATLILTRSTTGFVTPRSDDAAQAVGVAVASLERQWNPQFARLVGALVASCLAGVCATVLLRSGFEPGGPHRARGVGMAATASLLALASAAAAYRVIDEEDLGLVLGLSATAFAAIAGLLTVPGGPGAPNALFAAAAAAVVACVMRVIACHTVIFTAIVCFSAACATAALAGIFSAEPGPEVGAGLAAMSLAIIEAAPPLALMLGRLSVDDADSGPEQSDAKAVCAHNWLTSLVTALSASAALGAIIAATRMSLASSVFAVVIGTILVLRARTHHDVTRAATQLICGAATLSAALLTVAHPMLVAALSAALSVAALYLGFTNGFATVPAVVRRGMELLEYVAFTTVVPLTLWICGAFGAARGVNLL